MSVCSGHKLLYEPQNARFRGKSAEVMPKLLPLLVAGEKLGFYFGVNKKAPGG
jgi:hypothetical protein